MSVVSVGYLHVLGFHNGHYAFKILNCLNPETTNESQRVLDSVPIEIQVWHHTTATCTRMLSSSIQPSGSLRDHTSTIVFLLYTFDSVIEAICGLKH